MARSFSGCYVEDQRSGSGACWEITGLRRQPGYFWAGGAAASAVAGLEPELVEVSYVKRDRRGDLHAQRTLFAEGEELGHSAGAFAPELQARRAFRQGEDGEGAIRGIPHGEGGGGGDDLGGVAEHVDVPHGIDQLGLLLPNAHCHAYHFVKLAAEQAAHAFHIHPPIVQCRLAVKLEVTLCICRVVENNRSVPAALRDVFLRSAPDPKAWQYFG